MPSNANKIDLRFVIDGVMLMGLVVSFCFSVFLFFADIQANAQAIDNLEQEVQEVKDTHLRDKDDTYEELKEQRKETQESFDKVDQKLDKLLDYVIQQNGN